MELTHGMADIEPGLRLTTSLRATGRGPSSCCTASRRPGGNGSRVIPALVDAGFRSSRPTIAAPGTPGGRPGGYDKRTMAGDIRRLLRDHLGVDGPSCSWATTSG